MGLGCQRWGEVDHGGGGHGRKHSRRCGTGQRTGSNKIFADIILRSYDYDLHHQYDRYDHGGGGHVRKHIRRCGMGQRTGRNLVCLADIILRYDVCERSYLNEII